MHTAVTGAYTTDKSGLDISKKNYRGDRHRRDDRRRHDDHRRRHDDCDRLRLPRFFRANTDVNVNTYAIIDVVVVVVNTCALSSS